MIRSFANLKLVYKLFIPLSLLVITIGGILWTAQGGLVELHGAASTAIERTAARQTSILTAIGDINEASLLEKNILLSHDEAGMKAYRERYKVSISRALAAVDRLFALSDTPEQGAIAETLKNSLLEFEGVADKSIALALRNDDAGAFKVSSSELREARSRVMKLTGERLQRLSEDMVKTKASISALKYSALTRLYIFAGVGLALALSLLVAIVTLLVVQPLVAMAGSMQRLAVGDLAFHRRGPGGVAAGSSSQCHVPVLATCGCCRTGGIAAARARCHAAWAWLFEPTRQQGLGHMPGTDTDRQAPAGAKVIQFPGRIRPVPEAAAPEIAALVADDAAARLDQALLVLNQALARQQEAVQAWRQSLEELACSVGSLASSLHALDAGLEAASERLRMEPRDQANGKPM